MRQLALSSAHIPWFVHNTLTIITEQKTIVQIFALIRTSKDSFAQVLFLAVSQMVWSFSKKKFQNSIRHPISHRKGYSHFCRPTLRSPWKWSSLKELFFAVILENIVFSEKIVKWKIFKTSMPTKKVILIFVARHRPSPKNCMSGHKWFFAIFSRNTAFFENWLNNKTSFTQFLIKKSLY